MVNANKILITIKNNGLTIFYLFLLFYFILILFLNNLIVKFVHIKYEEKKRYFKFKFIS